MATSGNRGNGRVESATTLFRNRKVFNDPIHGHIVLHPVCVRIIDTPQFQRLRHIKQLDACYLIYPGACHNRFEHSLGTCHLAGNLMRTLMERQPDLQITQRDILCVEIAGLCHDLGQGPFSHIFEKRFMPRMKQQGFTHEHTAARMFEYLLEDRDEMVKKEIQTIIGTCAIPDFDQFEEDDFLFIKEMIDTPKDLGNKKWPYKGRTEDKSFMYEIVANKRNGIDVDKWDYLARDSYMLGMKVNFDHNRCFMSARVIKGNGASDSNGAPYDDSASTEMKLLKVVDDQSGSNTGTTPRKQICYREKDAQDLYDMFYTRMTLHRRAYQHKTHKIIGMMICDALVKANDSIKFIGNNGKEYSISEAAKDMEAYTLLTDDVFQIILYSQVSQANSVIFQSSDRKPIQSKDQSEEDRKKQDNFNEAKAILTDILRRKLFKFVSQTQIKDGKFDEIGFTDYFREELKPMQAEDTVTYDVVQLDYGMKNKNPMESVRFYRKENPDKPIKLKKTQVSFVLPDTFSETILRIYCKQRDNDDANKQHMKKIAAVFREWCDYNNHPSPKEAHRLNRNETIPSTEMSSEPNRENEDQTELKTAAQLDPSISGIEQSRGLTSEQENVEEKHVAEPDLPRAGEDHLHSETEGIGGVDRRREEN